MRAAFHCAFAVLLALTSAARAQRILEWDRFEIFAHLDNDGAVRVTETLTAKVNGKVEYLDRQFAEGVGQEIVIRSLAAVESGQLRPVTDYEYRQRMLLWRIRADDAPEWDDQTLAYRLEYDLRGAVTPAWDIPSGPGSFTSREAFPHFLQRWPETFAAWRAPRGRYRFDHEALFARFSSEGPKRLDYTFKYDTAWRHPQPDAPLTVRVTPEVGYRVTELRDYLRAGPPLAVALWQPQVRVVSIFAFAVAALVLWLIFAVGEVVRRGLRGPRIDRDWFREHIAPIPAEKLTRHAGHAFGTDGFPLMLSRWLRHGVVAIRESGDADPILHLRRLGGSVALAKYERTVLQRLFPKGPEITSRELAAVYAKEEFDPAEELADAMADDDSEDAETALRRSDPRFWVVLGRLMIPIFLAAAVLLLMEAFRSEYADSIQEGMYFVGGFVVLALVCRFAVSPLGGLARALVAFIPVAAAVPGVIALHFHHTLPLRAEGSAGLALLAFGCVVVWLQVYRVADDLDSPEQQRAELAKRYIRRQLRKPHPQLEDEWLPQIFALGFGADLEKWRAARSESLRVTDGEPPFTGVFSLAKEHEWTGLLTVAGVDD